jgi:hypothetical protein
MAEVDTGVGIDAAIIGRACDYNGNSLLGW